DEPTAAARKQAPRHGGTGRAAIMVRGIRHYFPEDLPRAPGGSATSSPGLQVPGAPVPPGLQPLSWMSCLRTLGTLDVPGHRRSLMFRTLGTVRGCALKSSTNMEDFRTEPGRAVVL